MPIVLPASPWEKQLERHLLPERDSLWARYPRRLWSAGIRSLSHPPTPGRVCAPEMTDHFTMSRSPTSGSKAPEGGEQSGVQVRDGRAGDHDSV